MTRVYYWTVLTVVTMTLRSTRTTRLSTLRPLERKVGTYESICDTKTFAPRCSGDEVVMVTYAQFGRMEGSSQCIGSNYGHVGCGVDVLTTMDRLCSGRRTCEVYMPEPNLSAAEDNCPKDFKSYLNVSFSCVKVEMDGCIMCGRSSSVARVITQKGYISGVVTQEDATCGTASCPWQITVEPGQNINVTLFDFSGKKDNFQDTFRYANIRETSRSDLFPISSGQGRVRHVYTSVTNSIDLRIISPEGFINRGLFLIYYEAIGCPDYAPPSYSWMKREHSKLTVGCEANSLEWELVCEGNRWTGDVVDDCPKPGPDSIIQDGEPVTLPLGVLVAIVIGIALVIGVLILTIGVVYLKRQQGWRAQGTYYYRTRHDYDYPMGDVVGPEMYVAPKVTGGPSEPSKYQPVMAHKYSSRDNPYRRRDMQSRPLPSLPNIAEASGGSGSTVSKSDDDPQLTQFAAEVHRSDSDRERRYLTYPRPSAARPTPVTAPQAPGARPMPPQYFVLDVNDENKAGRQAVRQAIAQASEAKPQKSPEQENAENASKEFSRNNSCHEIPLRPTRVSVNNVNNTSTENTTGKTSWP